MAKQGKRTPDVIRSFVIETHENAPDLTQAQIADRVRARYGDAAAIEKSTVGNFLRESRESSNVSPQIDSEDIEPEDCNYNPVIALVEVAPLGVPLKSHISASSLERIGVEFSLYSEGPEEYRFMRIHVWIKAGQGGQDPDTWDDSPWKPVDESPPPGAWAFLFSEEANEEGRQSFYYDNRWVRHTMTLSEYEKFILVPSNYPEIPPAIFITYRSFIGIMPLPWEIEIPGLPSIQGTLLLRVGEDSVLHMSRANDVDDYYKLCDEFIDGLSDEGKRRYGIIVDP